MPTTHRRVSSLTLFDPASLSQSPARRDSLHNRMIQVVRDVPLVYVIDGPRRKQGAFHVVRVVH
jgi:hypothetical protein